MELFSPLDRCISEAFTGFSNQDALFRFFKTILPAVERYDIADNIRRGDQALVQERPGNDFCLRFAGSGDVENDKIHNTAFPSPDLTILASNMEPFQNSAIDVRFFYYSVELAAGHRNTDD